MYWKDYDSPVGTYTMVSDGENLVGLWLKGQKYEKETVKEELLVENNELPIFFQVSTWLDCYFEGGNPELNQLPLAPKGSEFRQLVWNILCQIPYGDTKTYGEIAKIIEKKTGKTNMSAQAVGGAVGHNPISIIIPCHRVVGASGHLTGYAGGILKKIELLKLEGTDQLTKNE